MNGRKQVRDRQIQELFESSGIQVKSVGDIDSWQKYHVAFVLPIAGALLKTGDNYQLAKNNTTIRMYIKAVKEGGRVLKSLGYQKSFNTKFRLFYCLPENLLILILRRMLNSKFAEVAMMMHVRAAKDEMIELAYEFKSLMDQSSIDTPNLDTLIYSIDELKSKVADFQPEIA